jgi:hypothetical protein
MIAARLPPPKVGLLLMLVVLVETRSGERNGDIRADDNRNHHRTATWHCRNPAQNVTSLHRIASQRG